MSYRSSKEMRVLGIAPSSRGFGFAVLEGDNLVEWGVRTAKGEGKNSKLLAKVSDLITMCQPEAMILEDISAPVRRASRIRDLHAEIIEAARAERIKFVILPRRKVREAIVSDESATKQDVAEMLAKRFPNELGMHLPRKRKPWMSENHQMAMFDAVALVFAFRLKQKK
jgi:Holliday junction resolvasome RuvABC endonuclease subunit